jgi:hypothetical protein
MIEYSLVLSPRAKESYEHFACLKTRKESEKKLDVEEDAATKFFGKDQKL